uniref:DUF1725 domain-containing protein n=1 Tax=Monodon monoceros TaxID=40151 RepID=A0A8C6AWE2_MONMO
MKLEEKVFNIALATSGKDESSHSKRYLHPNVYSSTIDNKEWIKKTWHICTREYYSAVKKNEIMPFAATWMDLEIIVLSETEKDKHHVTSLICGT